MKLDFILWFLLYYRCTLFLWISILFPPQVDSDYRSTLFLWKLIFSPSLLLKSIFFHYRRAWVQGGQLQMWFWPLYRRLLPLWRWLGLRRRVGRTQLHHTPLGQRPHVLQRWRIQVWSRPRFLLALLLTGGVLKLAMSHRLYAIPRCSSEKLCLLCALRCRLLIFGIGSFF